MSDQAIAERVELDKKDKSELQAIVTALGGKSNSRMKKADLIDIILELSGVTSGAASQPEEDNRADEDDRAEEDNRAEEDSQTGRDSAASQPGPDQSVPEQTGGRESNADGGDKPRTGATSRTSGRRSGQGNRSAGSDRAGSSADAGGDSNESQPKASAPGDGNRSGSMERGESPNQETGSRRRRGKRRPDEPPAEWETELADGQPNSKNQGGNRNRGQQNQQNQQQGQQNPQQNQQQGNKSGQQQNQQQADADDDTEAGNRRRRRRGRGRDRDDNIEAVSQDPIEVSGYLDLRDDGYGFLRVSGLLPTVDDVYVPVKMVRQYGLRRGDLVAGSARPANRNEKNPALQQLTTINGGTPEESAKRAVFENLTPLFPDERIRLERSRQPVDLTARIIDLIAPIGKGQRGLIVSPPKAGKTTIMKEITTSIEENHPEIELIVLLIDERPEEVTDMRRHLQRGDVVASTFDRPTEEHCAVAELTIERAKRMVEHGKDVVVILDGITRLARAYNLSATGTGRVMTGGVDAGALYPPKKFLGAARNLEEGGSLTILATALVETGSRMDEVIFEEFKGTGNMELRLDRGLAERYVFPAIDALGSSTRRDELLMDGKEHVLSMKLRKVLAGMSAGEDGSAAAAMNLLMDRLKSFKTNEEFLAEIARSG